MKSNKYDIQDTEIRVLGDSSPAPKRKWGWIILIAALAIGVVASIIAFSCARSQEEEGVFEKSVRQVIPHPLRGWMQSLDSITDICVITKELSENELSVLVNIVTSTQNIAVGLPLLHLDKIVANKPYKGIKPEHTAQKLNRKALGRVVVADMTQLVDDNLLALTAHEMTIQINRTPEREWLADTFTNGERIRLIHRKLCVSAQAANQPQSIHKTSNIQRKDQYINTPSND